MVELNAAFPHPIELVGRHAQVWCHDCHEGVRKPEYECANCHEPPPAHFDGCEDCHTPAGFSGADWGDFQHPLTLEGAHAGVACAACHVKDRELTGACSDCHQSPPDHFGPDCQDCHTPAATFSEVRLPAEMHPVELVGKHQQAACEGCHGEGKILDPFVCRNCHERPESHLPGECHICHTPVGFTESASFFVSLAPRIEHDLGGREDCFVCHDPAGNVKPAPPNHAAYVNEQCTLCHK